MNKEKKTSLIRQYGIFIILVALVLGLCIFCPPFRTFTNIRNVLRQVSINGILAVGMTFVILTGGIDLSVGSLVALAGVIVGIQIGFQNVSVAAGTVNVSSVILAVLSALAACSLVGLINGWMIATFGIPEFVATMAMQTIARGAALLIAGGQQFIITDEKFKYIGQGMVGTIPVPVILLAVVLLVAGIILHCTVFGRRVIAVGGNRKASEASGISYKNTILWVYTISGFFSGLAGIVLASRISAGQPSGGASYEFKAITAVVIGGTSLSGGSGSILGTIIGMLMVGLLSNGMTLLNIDAYLQQIVEGVVIALAVILDTTSKRKA